jgi:hypothetical protein
MGSRIYFKLGTAILIAGGIGHFVLVDLATWWNDTDLSTLVPHADLFKTMRGTVLDFGFMGRTTVYHATAGFSVWVALSLVFLGVTFFLVARAKELRLRPFAWLGLVVSIAFFAVSAVCFIVPPTIAAFAAVALFAYSAIRNER